MMLFVLAAVAGSPPQSPDQQWTEHPTVQTARNRGRTRLAAGSLPEAVRAFRQAERMAPWDAGVRNDLATVREMTGDVPPPASWADRLGPADVWLIAIVASLFVVAGGTSLIVSHKQRWWLVVTIGMLGWIVLAMATLTAGRSEPFAIVQMDRITMRTGNAEIYSARPEGPLRIGQELTVLGRRGGWARVRTNTGAIGWVPDAAVLFE